MKSMLFLIQIIVSSAMPEVADEFPDDRFLREALVLDEGDRIISCNSRYCVEKEEHIHVNRWNNEIMVPNNLNITCVRCNDKGSHLAVPPVQQQTEKIVFQIRPHACPLYIDTVNNVNDGCKC